MPRGSLCMIMWKETAPEYGLVAKKRKGSSGCGWTSPTCQTAAPPATMLYGPLQWGAETMTRSPIACVPCESQWKTTKSVPFGWKRGLGVRFLL